MKLLILCGMTTIGVLVGTILGVPSPMVDGEFPMAWTIGGAFAGMFAGELLLQVIGSRRKRKPVVTPPPPSSDHPPASFRSRLARFSNCDEAELLDDSSPSPQSSMPFWSASRTFTPHPPRPAGLFRRILHRIRRILRSETG